MLVLGIDTCCMPATSAVYDGEKLVGEAIVNCGKTHSQKIMPQIAGTKTCRYRLFCCCGRSRFFYRCQNRNGNDKSDGACCGKTVRSGFNA